MLRLAALRALAAEQPLAPLPVRLFEAGLFAAIALAVLGLFLALVYESVALATGALPTISMIAGGWTANHPVWTPIVTFVVGLIVAALIVHFTGWRP